MTTQALKSGLDHFIGKRRAPNPLRAVLQHFMNQTTGASGRAAAPLAGRRILLATGAAPLADALRRGGADVLQAAAEAALPQQLAAAGRVDAVVLALDATGATAFAQARAVRAGNGPWAATPLLALAADPDAFAAAATAAGIDGLLARPVEATLLYETLTRFISGGPARVQRAVPAGPATATSVTPEALLNLPRLDSYQRIGMLDELVNDYLPEMKRLVAAVHVAAGQEDRQACLAALHSLLGMSGEAGAQSLYQYVRKLYVPLLEHGDWPAAADWLPQLAQLAARTEEALKAYCARQARSGAA